MARYEELKHQIFDQLDQYEHQIAPVETTPVQETLTPETTITERQTLQPTAVPAAPIHEEQEPIAETQEVEESELITSGYEIETPE